MKEYLIKLVSLVGIVGTFSTKINNTSVDDDCWWGPNTTNVDTEIRSFKIEFGEDMIADLKYRLKKHRPFFPPLEGVGFEYGYNSAQLESWLTFWAEEYDFKARENFFNQYSHYKVYIQGLQIHYIRVTTEVESDMEVLPLLLVHGWAGSIREFYDVIPLLIANSKKRGFALDIIVPSLPGFGYSDPAVRPGLGAIEMGVIIRNLMHRLGYTKFYMHGTDVGALVCSSIATLFPEETLGYHTNFAVSLHPKSLIDWALGALHPTSVVDASVQDRMYPLGKLLKFYLLELGYLHIQSSKSDTVGIAISESPVSLLVYVLQVVSMATRRANIFTDDGALDKYYTKNQTIDNLMMYWAPNTTSMTTAMRVYAETVNLKTYNLGIFQMPTSAPTWTLHASDEIIYQSPQLLKHKFTNLVNSTVLETGGHFIDMELPDVLADNILVAIQAFRSLNTTT